ncbi:MAG: hypothetical protein AAFY78_17890 [Cyanobacteria bacterium J06648_16]
MTDSMQAVSLVSQIAGVISVVFAAISIRSNTRMMHRQWNVDTFMNYSQRHQKAISQFPHNAFYHRFDDARLPPKSPELTQAVLDYLFVICDVHYLSTQRYLDPSIWNVWSDDLDRTLSCPLIEREWAELKPQFEPFEAFVAFVEQKQQPA